jgi:hypothetical protein
MPALQTTYTNRISPAYEGMIADEQDHTVLSKQVETAAGIGFGKIACQGTTDDQIVVATAGRPWRGITVAAHNAQQSSADSYAQYETAPVLEKGVIWVTASVAVAVGDLVYFVPATGVFTNVVGANTIVPGAIWDSSTSGAGLARVRIR